MKQRGFTLIELLWVLVIAALLMVLVLLAIQQGRNSRKDNDREADAARYLNATKTWTSDNNGNLPGLGDINNIVTTYIGNTFVNPEGVPWSLVWSASQPPGFSPATNEMVIGSGNVKCDSSGVVPGGGSRQVAVAVLLESGNVYCVTQ
ncbi:MAG TPA: type II secretion system protein [Candidatus Saccharimonadales bacterium]|nr:type II secretion system protein [Candidatus Saccharimonadales bacterium]